MESSLDSILSGTPVQQPEVQPETEAPKVEQPQETGEEVTGTPPEQPQKDDPLEKHRKGLEAAAAAERKKRQDAEQRAEAAERRAMELEALQMQRQQPMPQVKADDPKPLRQHFATEDEWLDARDEWRDRQVARASEERKQLERAKTLYEKTETLYAQAQGMEGFDRAAFDRLPLTKPIVEALIESEHGPRLMQFMTANPAEVARIAGLSQTRQYQEIARIEDRLSVAAEEPEEPEPKARPQLPKTLTQARNAKGRFEPAYSGPTPLNAILKK